MENEKRSNDLPLELIREILLRLPVKSLLRLWCVCKTWLHLISDPNFAKSHLELAAAPTHRFLFIQGLKALSYDLDALFRGGHAAINFCMPCRNPFTVDVLGSCRGFILLDEYPNLIIWNPSTGTHKRISYSHVLSASNVRGFHLLGNVLLYGFGYDESKDDYLVVLAWRDKNKEGHLDFFSVRNDSWKNFEVALPNGLIYERRCGLFLNGAFHWLGGPRHRDDPLLVFDLQERMFLKIPLPEQVVIFGPSRLMELKGCLAFYFWNNERKPLIWVMKDYKLQSSWNFYGTFHAGFIPVSSSHDGDITGYDASTREFSKYNVSGQKLEHWSCQPYLYDGYTMYTESLLSLPNYSEGKKKGHQVRQECFEQLDAITNNNHNEVKERKRIRSAPSWTRDFYCN